jgi:hypothetical protein
MDPPPPTIPACSVGEVLSMIRAEFASQNQLLNNRCINLKQDYNELKDEFRLSVSQTDRILAEQYSQFEVKLERIREEIHHLRDGQAATMGDLRARLDTLEGLTEASRNALGLKIHAAIETTVHGFNGLVAVIKSSDFGEPFYLVYPSSNVCLARFAVVQVPFPGQSGIPVHNGLPEGAIEAGYHLVDIANREFHRSPQTP